MLNTEVVGLDSSEAATLICAHFFEPRLLEQFSPYQEALEWSRQFFDHLRSGNTKTASEQYRNTAEAICPFIEALPPLSSENPPFSIASDNGITPSIPWRSDNHISVLLAALTSPPPVFWPWPPTLFIAFVENGGPGDDKEHAFRIHASSQSVRASAEHWLLRAVMPPYKPGIHFSLSPDEYGRKYSLHSIEDLSGNESSIYFDVTDSFANELNDLKDFLHRYPMVQNSL